MVFTITASMVERFLKFSASAGSDMVASPASVSTAAALVVPMPFHAGRPSFTQAGML